MKKNLLYIIALTILNSCSYYEVTNEDISNINIEQLTPQNISTHLPIININVDQAEFDYMYSHYTEEHEVSGFIQMWKLGKGGKKHEIVVDNTLVDIEIKGTSSAEYPLKSLGIKFDKSLDNESTPFFTPVTDVQHNHQFKKIKSMRLRNSGNDYGNTMIKDITYTKLAIDNNMDMEYMYYEPVHTFINNKYYGFLNLRSEKNQNGISRLLGDYKKDDIIMIKVNDDPNGWGMDFKGEDDLRLQKYVDAIKAKDLNYLESETDIDSFIDYVVFNDFIGNTDWPHNNIIMYSLLSNKFRFISYDMDYAGTRNKYFVDDNLDKDEFLIALFNVLSKNPETSSKIKAKQIEIINNGFSANDFNSKIDFNANNIEYDILYDISKYGLPDNSGSFYLNIQKLMDAYKFRVESYKKHYKI